jgi:hypothetical protein
MTDYHNDTKIGESYREITRKDYPNWGGWKEIDRHKEMYGFPENLAFSNVLEILYKDWKKFKIIKPALKSNSNRKE